MTQAEFTAFYPQFAGFTPAVVLSSYIAQANTRFSTFTEEDAEEARRLFVAHKLTLYARMALPDGTVSTKAQIAAAGQRVSSKKVGEVSVTYATGASSSSVSADIALADLTETSFGLQLLSLLRLCGMPRYVP